MKLICVLAICLAAVGCNEHRDLTEYSLDEQSFDSEAMMKIELETGIDLPDRAKGLAFLHIPPVDPMVFARIQIPDNAQELLIRQIEELQEIEFPDGFANDRCDWWPPPQEQAVLWKRAFNNEYYIELYLVIDQENPVLYLQYFTM